MLITYIRALSLYMSITKSSYTIFAVRKIGLALAKVSEMPGCCPAAFCKSQIRYMTFVVVYLCFNIT